MNRFHDLLISLGDSSEELALSKAAKLWAQSLHSGGNHLPRGRYIMHERLSGLKRILQPLRSFRRHFCESNALSRCRLLIYRFDTLLPALGSLGRGDAGH
jgi:hypothetical protein